MKKKVYEAPLFEALRVELEQGFMKASVFEPGEGHDKGVSIEGHKYGNYGNYFDNDNGIDGWNDWDN